MRQAVYTVSANGEEAQVYTYLLTNEGGHAPAPVRPLVVICPGGGYVNTADHEAEPIAIQMNALGIHAVVLRYSVKPATFPTALLQLAQTVALVRASAEEWRVQPDKVFVLGFSAGGHLAGSLGVLWNKGIIEKEIPLEPEQFRPNGMVLCYAVLTSGEFYHGGSFQALLTGKEHLRAELSLENRVDEGTPPCFLWHTYEDGAVPVENSLLFADRLRKHGVRFEMHIFECGGHGLGLDAPDSGREAMPNVPLWPIMAGAWMRK